ncbi:helix-turn-helix transcriptional regulator [Lewinella sp. IMCC34183]|uniref:helix-turn-helix transcriptional regulator n=1 Tax=Lewinella sp. IMCC34183 TaxID=2248762 RepID=UPI000E23F6BB|nr:helix-turn-helix transcriptional regulator [Lewinella sp. IMCC34183]
MYLRSPLMLLLLLAALPVLAGPVTIRGLAPETYRGQVVYLDVLDVPLGVVSIREDQLLAQAEIDSAGHFAFADLTLPDRPNLYRIRYGVRERGPFNINTNARHYVILILAGGEDIRVNGLGLQSPSPTNRALLTVQEKLDSFSTGSGAVTDRQESLVRELRRRYLRQVLHDATADPYARIFALGGLGYEVPTLPDLVAASSAVEETELPKTFGDAIDRQLGGFAFQRLKRENTFLWLGLLLSLAVSGVLASLLWRSRRSPTVTVPDATEELSPKEREVAALIAVGHTNKEVAAELYVSVSTVKTHLNSIYRKLGVSSREQLKARLSDDSTPV